MRSSARRRRPLGCREGATGVPENAGHDAIADRRLIVAAAAAGPDQKLPQAPQGGRLMLVAPQPFERGIIMLERCAECFDRQRKDLLG